MRLHLLAVSFAALLVACGGSDNALVPGTPDPVDTPLSKLRLKQFESSCADFLDYAADAYTEQYLAPRYCLDSFAPCPVYAGAPGATDGASGGTGGGSAPTPERVSSTNTQEAGVDEADIVKADSAGNLYVISGRLLSVLQAFPPAGLESRSVTTVELAGENDGFYANDFFLDEAAHRLVVMGERYSTVPQSVNIILDVTDPSAPTEVSRLTLDGYGLEARRVGSRIHRVSRYDVPTPSWFYDNDDPLVQKRQQYQEAVNNGDEARAQQIKDEVRAEIGRRVDDAGAAALLPHLSVETAGGTTTSQMACGDIAHPEVTTGMGIALIDSFGTGGALRAASGVINNAYLVYGSAQNLYLVQNSYGWFWAPGQTEQTAIYRLALSETGAAQYRGVGMVDGSVNNAYAMSEFDGVLRVASTETTFKDNRAETRNQVALLDASGTDLPQVGILDSLAPGERIQGTRFVGDRGYVVTFRQIDPLFALDLSNPSQPRVADELKIPGFSSYLMPLGSDYLLTIGRAGDDQQLNGQVGIQLFDVHDASHISQVAAVSPEAGSNSYTYSSAEYDPHAFSYFPDSSSAATPGTLSVPLQSYDNNTGEGFAGFLVMRIEPGTSSPLREIGRISHDSFATQGTSCSSGGSSSGGSGGGSTGAPGCYDYYYSADPRRSVFMQDSGGTYLFTLSTLGVIASDATAPETELGRHELPHEDFSCCVAYPAR